MTGGDVPDLSVVVAATDSPRAADRAVRALAGPARGPVEILVVDGFGADGSDPPCGARRIAAPPGSGVPRLRRLGLEAATGRVVAFTEDSCLAAPGWADAWMAAFEDPALAAASGVVEHGLGASTLDWAVVFCEYAPFLPPTPPGPPDRLAGNNFAAPRALALRGSAAEVHETALLAAVRRDPGATRTVDRAVVHHVRRFDPGRAIGDRLRSGLEYGWLRARDLRPAARFAGWIAGPAIFGAQVGRLLRAVLRNRRHLGPFAEALPITLALLAAWSVGEWVGWSLGSLGSPDRGPSPVDVIGGGDPPMARAGSSPGP
jgi:hypothetical protein